jgi:hypothetical protein
MRICERNRRGYGIMLAACSRIRTGKRVPRPKHWSALLALLE